MESSWANGPSQSSFEGGFDLHSCFSFLSKRFSRWKVYNLIAHLTWIIPSIRLEWAKWRNRSRSALPNNNLEALSTPFTHILKSSLSSWAELCLQCRGELNFLLYYIWSELNRKKVIETNILPLLVRYVTMESSSGGVFVNKAACMYACMYEVPLTQFCSVVAFMVNVGSCSWTLQPRKWRWSMEQKLPSTTSRCTCSPKHCTNMNNYLHTLSTCPMLLGYCIPGLLHLLLYLLLLQVTRFVLVHKLVEVRLPRLGVGKDRLSPRRIFSKSSLCSTAWRRTTPWPSRTLALDFSFHTDTGLDRWIERLAPRLARRRARRTPSPSLLHPCLTLEWTGRMGTGFAPSPPCSKCQSRVPGHASN